MAQLNYQVLKESGYKGYILENAPEKVMQFGEGNFLRAFVDYFFDVSNEKVGYNGKVVLVQPIAQGLTDLINQQEGLYTLYLRGNEKGVKVDDKRVISSVSRCINPYQDWDKVLEFAKSDDLDIIVSNTTEAGMLSCELIDNNGKELLKCVNQYIDDWKLPEDFRAWVNNENIFCSTLVDRIVPGRIRDAEEVKRLNEENGYEDPLMDVGEVFGVWVIEGPESLENRLPFKAAGLPVHVVPDVTPYKKRKVRILNGAHTGFVLGAYLAGFDIVRDCMNDDVIRGFMNKMLYDEIVPILPLDQEDCKNFAAAVQDRFNNPFVNHELMSISLNSTSKWKARNMPSFLEYVNENKALPPCLTMSLAAYIAFYSNDIQELSDKGLVCKRPKGNTYLISDDRWALEFYYAHKDDTPEALVHAVLTNEQMWDQDLTKVPGLEDAVVKGFRMIREKGAKEAFASCL